MERKSFDGYYYKVDEYDHVHGEDGATTDPFENGGGLHLSLLDLPETEAWDGDDHIDFDFLMLEAHVAIHASIDCDSGSFVQDFGYEVVRPEHAVATLEGMIDSAHDWYATNWPEHTDKVSADGAARVLGQLKADLTTHEFDAERVDVDTRL